MFSRLREGRILGVPFVLAVLLLFTSQQILPIHGAGLAQPLLTITETSTSAVTLPETPTEAPTETPTEAPTETPEPSETAAPHTATPEPPAATETQLPTVTAVQTVAPTNTATQTPASTPGATAIPTRTATASPTPTPSLFTIPHGNKYFKIMALGDSLTEGSTPANNGPGSNALPPWFSYRGALQMQLQEAGVHFDFVGTLSALPPDGIDGDHEGWGGALIGPDARLNLLTQMRQGMSIHHPDVILLMIGSNDVSYNANALTPAQTADKLSQLVATVIADQPQALVLLATLPPWRDPMTTAFAATYDAINVRARALASQPGDHVYLADMNGALSENFHAAPGAYFTDFVHWTELGSHRAAGVWFNALGAALQEESMRKKVYIALLNHSR